MAMLIGGALSLVALAAGLASLLLALRQTAPGRRKAIAAVVLALPLVGFLGSRPMSAGDVPAIHDVTTDPAHPPQFRALALRADHLAGEIGRASCRGRVGQYVYISGVGGI